MPGTLPPGAAGTESRDERVIGEYAFGAPLRARIVSRLGTFNPHLVSPEELRRAAVAIALVAAADGQAACLLTQRPMTLRRHPGQFALPGGRVDAGEHEADAALRELREELGLSVGPEAILGSLDDYVTQSGFRIRPFVAWIEDSEALAPDPREVASCYRVPLAELAAPEQPAMRAVSYSENPTVSLYLPTIGDELHAPTGALLYQFREVALYGRHTRVSHFAQPRFAWR